LLCCLSVEQGGHVRSWIVYFARLGSSDLVYATEPESNVSRALLPGREVSVGVFNDRQPWGEPHWGVRLVGLVEKLTEAEASKASHAYVMKFPQSRILVSEGHFDLYAIRVSVAHVVAEKSFGSGTSYILEVGTSRD